jgi:hypothetical protein
VSSNLDQPRYALRPAKALSGPIRACVIRRLVSNSKVIKRGEWKCWEWQGALNRDGYGRINIDSHQRGLLAHRVSYVAFVEDLPDEITVDHRCLNRRCINPEHLIQKTHGDNTADANRRRRKTKEEDDVAEFEQNPRF